MSFLPLLCLLAGAAFADAGPQLTPDGPAVPDPQAATAPAVPISTPSALAPSGPSTPPSPASSTVAGISSISAETLAAMMASLDDRQRLGAGDKVLFRIIEDQDPPVSLTVTDTGDLDIPYYGLVPAAGRTCRELAREIKSLVEKDLYYRATVVLGLELINKGRTAGRVYVVGQVKKTGPLDMPGSEEFTVSKAILGAGGFSDFADKKKVRIVRAGKGDTAKRTIIVNVSDIWEKGQLENDLKLEPEDLVYVPARMVNW